MKSYTAFVKDKETKEQLVITKEYASKKDFKRDLIGNGYAVKFISESELFDQESEKYHNKLQLQRNIAQAKASDINAQAKKHGCTAKVYKRAYDKWLNSETFLSLNDLIEIYKD